MHQAIVLLCINRKSEKPTFILRTDKMEKLIELLNKQMEEKEKKWPKLARFISYDSINKVFDLNNGCSFCVEFVLGKRYWFIKWLVDNDKIDFIKLIQKQYPIKELEYYRLLMSLSIQENPIEFLISILE